MFVTKFAYGFHLVSTTSNAFLKDNADSGGEDLLEVGTEILNIL
jgi:hypothetical protein